MTHWRDRYAVWGWCGWVLWVVAGMAIYAGEVRAQDVAGEVIDEVQVLASLNDEDYSIRQAMTRRLLADDAMTPDDLDRLILASETFEQRHRLMRVAKHHAIRRMINVRFPKRSVPGSMGLSHVVVHVPSEQGGDSRVGVMAAMTLPGFPAYALLEPGDVIVAFDGEPMPANITGPQFQQKIQGRYIGEEIGLTVIRNGDTLNLQFKLGNGRALSEVYDQNGVVLNGPYRDAWEAERVRLEGLFTAEGETDTDDAPDDAD